jgi:hypothetical protein
LECEGAGHTILAEFFFQVCDDDISVLVDRGIVSNNNSLREDGHSPEREAVREIVDESAIILQ